MKGRRGRKRALLKKPDTVIVDDYETVCKICDAEFLDEEDLKMHVEQMHLSKCNGRMLCNVCHVVLPGAEMFAYHYIDKHLESSSFCFYCYRVFFDPVLLDQHELKHRAVADYAAVSCSQCSAVMADRYKLQDHEYQEHRNCQEGLMLNSFFPLLSIELNMNVKRLIDCLCKNIALVCCSCKHTTLSLNDYLRHLMIMECECCVCDKCCNVYKNKNSITTHIVKSRQCQNYIDKEVVKKCPKCDKCFNSTELSTHVTSCNIIKCSTCEELFTSINELADHRVTEHVAKITLMTCKLCHRQFVGKLTLQRHIDRTHRNKGQYKYNCVYCGCVFAHPRRLFAHFFTKHKDIQPYMCTICGQRFRLRKHFTFHIKLKHESIGYVEFDKKFHVLFSAKPSKTSASPKANIDLDSSTDASDIDRDGNPRVKMLASTPQSKQDPVENNDLDKQPTTHNETGPKISKDRCNILTEPVKTVEVNVERLEEPEKRKLRPRPVKQLETISVDSPEDPNSEEEPLSNIRESLMKEKYQKSINPNKKIISKDKTAKLTCNICKKYCYTVQYYHHHLTLHEKSKMKRCIKCNKYFKTRRDLQEHIANNHTSSRLVDTLKSVLEKRKKSQPVQQARPGATPGESLKYVLEERKKQKVVASQNSITTRFRRTIQKVDFEDQSTATLTPLSEHGLSVKNFIENFKPEGETVSISNSVTMKALSDPVTREPIIKMRPFNPSLPETYTKLRFPIRFKDDSETDTKISVKLVQQLVTKPKAVNMVYDERIPPTEEKIESDEYCNMFADETDYSQYRNDIPYVAQEVMLGNPEDIPRTRRLAREIYIPKIGEEHGGVRIGHLLPEAPYYKIVKVKKLLDAVQDQEPRPPVTPVVSDDKDVQLPDGTRLISVKNPFAHLIANDHLEEILKANRSKYYTPKTKHIGKAIAKALNTVRPPRKSRRKVKGLAVGKITEYIGDPTEDPTFNHLNSG